MGRHKNPRTTVTLDPESYRILQDLARESGRPVARVASLIIRGWLREHGEKALRDLRDSSRSTKLAREGYIILAGQIRRVGVNLNQLVHLAHRYGLSVEILEQVNKIWGELAKISSEWAPQNVLVAAKQAMEENRDNTDSNL